MTAIAAAALAAIAASCTGKIDLPPDGSGVSPGASEAAFRAWAGDYLGIRMFRLAGTHIVEVPDRFRNVMFVTIEDADVDVRYIRSVRCPAFDEILERMLDKQNSVGVALSEISRGRVLGEGEHPKGEETTLHISVLHEWTGSGWRFLSIDRRLGGRRCGL